MEINEIKELPGLTRDELAKFLVTERHFIGAELGVQKGEYSEILLRAGVLGLILVDLWAQQENYFDIANVADAEHEKNLQETQKRLEFSKCFSVLRGSSITMATYVDNDSLDFVYHDSKHSKDHVSAEMAAWYPKVKPGGIISGHDYLDSENCCGSEFGVKSAVREFCQSIGVTEIFVCQSDGPFHNWYFRKP